MPEVIKGDFLGGLSSDEFLVAVFKIDPAGVDVVGLGDSGKELGVQDDHIVVKRN